MRNAGFRVSSLLEVRVDTEETYFDIPSVSQTNRKRCAVCLCAYAVVHGWCGEGCVPGCAPGSNCLRNVTLLVSMKASSVCSFPLFTLRAGLGEPKRFVGEGYCGCREKPVKEAVPISGMAGVCHRCAELSRCPGGDGPECQGLRFPSPC